MEGQSTNNNSSISSISTSLGNLSRSTLVQLDTRDATVLSAMEAHQLSSDAPTSFKHMLDNNHDTNLDLNVSYVPPISNSDFLDHPVSATPFTYYTARTSVNTEGEVRHIIQAETRTQIYQSTLNSSNQVAGMTQNTGTTSSGNITLFGNVIGHSSRPHRNHNIGSGGASNDYIILFGNVIHRPNRPCPSHGIGSNGARNDYITLFGNVIHRPNRPCPSQDIGSGRAIERHSSYMGMDIGSVNDTTEINHGIFAQHSSGYFHSREFIAQTLSDSNAPIPMPYAPLATSSSRARYPDDAVESIHLPTADGIQGHPTGHAENQDEATNTDDEEDYGNMSLPTNTDDEEDYGNISLATNTDDEEQDLDLLLGWMSDEEIEDLINEMRVNMRLTQEEILQGLNPRKYLSSGRNDEGEQENCCICLDELGAGQDLVKLDCGHDYHFECIKQWLAEKNCCALCKKFALRVDRD